MWIVGNAHAVDIVAAAAVFAIMSALEAVAGRNGDWGGEKAPVVRQGAGV